MRTDLSRAMRESSSMLMIAVGAAAGSAMGEKKA